MQTLQILCILNSVKRYLALVTLIADEKNVGKYNTTIAKHAIVKQLNRGQAGN